MRNFSVLVLNPDALVTGSNILVSVLAPPPVMCFIASLVNGCRFVLIVRRLMDNADVTPAATDLSITSRQCLRLYVSASGVVVYTSIACISGLMHLPC